MGFDKRLVAMWVKNGIEDSDAEHLSTERNDRDKNCLSMERKKG
jgi:hypothetical protein